MTRVLEPARGPILFRDAFRVFFLSAAAFGVFAMAVWLGWLYIHAAGAVLTYVPFSPPPHQWHAHEMIFGYAGAVLAGFFLTAVPSWTNTEASRPMFLAGLAALWLTGRVALFFSSALPAHLVMAVDVTFIPALGLSILINLMKRPKPQNMLFLLLLAMLTAGNIGVHLEWTGITADTAEGCLRLGLLTLAAMIAILGGRVTPGFTRNAMVRRGIESGYPVSRHWLDRAGIASALLLALLVAFEPPAAVLGSLAAVAACANAGRLLGWRTAAVTDQPILWSLHLGFAMLAAGYAALSAHWFGLGMSEAAALHVIAIGAVGGMTLAVMSRAALGHSGRALVVSTPIAVAYGLMALAAVVRSMGVTVAPAHYFPVMFVSGALWIAAFTIFIAVYAPIVLAPRVDSPA